METNHTLTFKKELTKRLNEKFPNFENDWIDIVKLLGNDFVNTLKGRFEDEYSLFKEISTFSMTIVVDNNFVLGQIKGLIKSNRKLDDSFVYKISSSKLVEVFAPPKFKEEIYRKIQELLPENLDLATDYANKLLERITIKDAFWIDEWKRANNLIGHIDKDDVPYLALAFHIGSHAIISYDKIFHKQGDVKVWDIEQTEKIITNYHSGFMSFFFIGAIPAILKCIWRVCIAFFKLIGEVIVSLIDIAGLIVAGAVNLLLKVPQEIYLLLLFIGIGGLIVSEDFRKKGKDFLIRSTDIIKNCLNKLGELLNKILELIGVLLEGLKPIGITTLEIIGYFTFEYQLMVEQVERLETERAK